MARFFSICMDLFADLLLLPILFCLCSLPFFGKKRALWKTVYLLLGMYLCAVFSATGMPSVTSLRFDPSVNLIPFADIVNSPASYLVNTVLNVILFLPFGMFLPFLWKKFRRAKLAAAAGFGLSLLIEILQLYTFRATDVDDLITNTFGTLAGYWILAAFLRLCPIRLPEDGAETHPAAELAVNVGAVLFLVFFVQPFIVKRLYVT